MREDQTKNRKGERTMANGTAPSSTDGYAFAPLFFIRYFLGTCFCDEYNDQLQIYRLWGRPRVVAVKLPNGSWHIRRKYRLFYSARLIRKLEKNYRKINA